MSALDLAAADGEIDCLRAILPLMPNTTSSFSHLTRGLAAKAVVAEADSIPDIFRFIIGKALANSHPLVRARLFAHHHCNVAAADIILSHELAQHEAHVLRSASKCSSSAQTPRRPRSL